jgi:hypothetical protein
MYALPTAFLLAGLTRVLEGNGACRRDKDMATRTTARNDITKASAVKAASRSDTMGNDAGTPNRSRSSAMAGHPRRAAEQALRHNSVQVHLPIMGKVVLPAKDELAYLGGVVALAIVGVVEWPIAAVLGAGHILAASHHHKMISEFGEALEAA